MKPTRLHLLCLTGLLMAGISSPASAAISVLRAYGAGMTVQEAGERAQRNVLEQCTMMFGVLLGEPDIIPVRSAANPRHVALAVQACNH